MSKRLSRRRRRFPGNPGTPWRYGRALRVPIRLLEHRARAARRLGTAITIAREALDVSADELAAAISVGRWTVLRWERGEACVPICQVWRIALALAIAPSAILEVLDD